MSGPTLPPGRSNGLTAGAYVALVDCDPPVADALLERLAGAGVAAYVAAAPGRVGGYLQVSLPAHPADRVFVDATLRGQAEAVLRATLTAAGGASPASPGAPAAPVPAGHGPGGEPSAEELERRWQELVSAFDEEALPAWPDREELDQPRSNRLPWPGQRDRPAPAAPVTPAPATPLPAAPLPAAPLPAAPLPAGPLPPAPGRAADGPDPLAEEHYQPPEPEPIPRLTPLAWWAVLGLLGGLVLLFSPVIPGLHYSAGAQGVGVVCVLGGVGAVVLSLKKEPPDPDDPDDGAVV